MNSERRTIFIVSADSAVTQGCIQELDALGGHYLIRTANSVELARRQFHHTTPAVVFLDESAVGASKGGDSLEFAVASLTGTSPVVVAAAPANQVLLAFLITSGAVDFVARTDCFLPIAAGLLDRRVRMAERVSGMIDFPNNDSAGDFGEILRHEVNNPLTGILGNTELLLARRDGLPPSAIERLETIAELAVRLRETVRRLSNAWEERHQTAPPARSAAVTSQH
jgi:signal transduction histidine kinase